MVKDSSSAPIENAKITIEDESVLTDATGIATVDLQAKTYSNITVEKDGKTATFTPKEEVAEYPVTFVLKDS